MTKDQAQQQAMKIINDFFPYRSLAKSEVEIVSTVFLSAYEEGKRDGEEAIKCLERIRDWTDYNNADSYISDDPSECLETIHADVRITLGLMPTAEQSSDVQELHAHIAELERALSGLHKDVTDLIRNSEGVTGVNLNGDVASWDQLLIDDPVWLGNAMNAARALLEKGGAK